MVREIDIAFDKEMHLVAFQRHFWWNIPPQTYAVLVGSLVGGVFYFTEGEMIVSASFSGFFLVGILVHIWMFVRGYLTTLETLRLLPSSTVGFYVHEKGFDAKEGIIFKDVTWRSIISLLRYDDMWIFFTSRRRRLVIPPDTLSEELKIYILNNLSVTKARIR